MNSGRYATAAARMLMRTFQNAGAAAVALWAGVSASQLCTANMTDVQPMSLLRVKI